MYEAVSSLRRAQVVIVGTYNNVCFVRGDVSFLAVFSLYVMLASDSRCLVLFRSARVSGLSFINCTRESVEIVAIEPLRDWV